MAKEGLDVTPIRDGELEEFGGFMIVRAYHSPVYYESAYLFAHKAQQIEETWEFIDNLEIRTNAEIRKRPGSVEIPESEQIPDPIRLHAIYCVSAITTAYAFLEARVNEFLEDASAVSIPVSTYVSAGVEADPFGHFRYSVDPSLRKRSALFRDLLDKERSISKFNYILAMAGQEVFHLGEEPAQSVDLVRRLRNELVHYRPRDSEYGGEKATHMEEKLRSKRLATNPLLPDWLPYFPNRCLSYALCTWAIESCHRLSQEFLARMGHREEEIPDEDLPDYV